jgi:hypothetical protein
MFSPGDGIVVTTMGVLGEIERMAGAMDPGLDARNEAVDPAEGFLLAERAPVDVDGTLYRLSFLRVLTYFG